MKKVVVISDTHCGSPVGLTHPNFWVGGSVGKEQERLWGFFDEHAQKNADVLIYAGDAIDGAQPKTSGVELQTADRNRQVKMALAVVERLKPKALFMVYGTRYHVGQSENWEDILADRVKDKLRIPVTIGPHEQLLVNGLLFDVKHKVAGSSVPHGRHTPIAKEKLWNVIWAAHGQRPVCDVLLRGHVHYYAYCGDRLGLCVDLPSLQGLGCDYGARECSGTVDFGLVEFSVESRTKWSWKAHIMPHKKAGAVVV